MLRAAGEVPEEPSVPVVVALLEGLERRLEELPAVAVVEVVVLV